MKNLFRLPLSKSVVPVIILTVGMMLQMTKPLSAQVISVGQTFSSDTIFKPFSGNAPVYSLYLYGSVQLFSDSSLLRVVLVDAYGNNLLIYESYPLITDSNTFSIVAGCDETCFMPGIIPDSLRVDIISAFCTIDSLKIDPNYIPNVTELKAQSKWHNDSVKISMINHRIQEEHMYWRAGETYLSEFSYQEKVNMFGSKHVLFGLDYFKGGIFERWPNRVVFSSPAANIDGFDWRLRHGAIESTSPYWSGRDDSTGWLSPIKNQGSCNSCWVFGPVGCVEAMYNLYYNIHDASNPHHFDVNISEMDIWNCPYRIFTFCIDTFSGQGGNTIAAMGRMVSVSNQRCDESCFDYETYKYTTGCNKCSNPDTLISLTDTIHYKKYFNQYTNILDKISELQKILVTRGPVCMTVNIPTSQLDHAMVAVGWKTYNRGDLVYKGTGPSDPDIILDDFIPTDNWLVWIFKNSKGSYMPYYPISNSSDLLFDETYGPTEEMLWIGHDPYKEIICSDEDGDGYYWWGVHHHKDGTPFNPQDCNCPPSVKAEYEDCNDNDITAGPYATPENNPENQPYYSCIPNQCVTSENPYYVNQNGETWSIGAGDRHINSNIIIPSGSTLTIKCQVFFTPNTKIIVKPGGTLKLEGTYLNPARLSSGCGEFWGGIEIQGDPTMPQNQFYQGTVIINYGIIDNATCGIKTINAGVVPDGGGVLLEEGTPSGGIIQATGAIFRNNVTGVEFLPYQDGNTNPNISFFKACTFETTDNLLNNEIPENLLKVVRINNLSVLGCTFRNSQGNAVPFENRGNGIYLYNAQMEMDILPELNNIPVDLECKFDSLKYGIYAMTSSMGSSSLKVNKSKFMNNEKAFYASGFTNISPVEITNNQFSFSNPIGADTIYMLYLNNCTGFKVSQNSFMGTTNYSLIQFGVIVNNSGTENNYIYDNQFQRLTYGIQGLNINRNSDAAIEGGVPVYIPTGLRFICNKMQDITYQNSPGCNYDFLINENLPSWISLPGIAYNQRNATNISAPTQEPAGNVFTYSHSTGNTSDYDIDISTSVGKILYTHHTSSDPSWLKVKPTDVSNPDWVNYQERILTYSEESSCPDTFFPDGDEIKLRSALNQSDEKSDSLIALLQLFVDDGSTDTLKSIVENSSSSQSYEVYQNLMSVSPYLSDSVVNASIEKEDVLPNAMIRDIMVTNPQSAKNEELLSAIDERTNPMPDSLWVDILQGMDTVGAMERLIDELAGWMQKRDLYFNALAELLSQDTVNMGSRDSLVSLYMADNRSSSKYLLSQFYLNKSDFSSAAAVLQNIPLQFDLTKQQAVTHSKLVELISSLSKLYADTSGYLMPDSLEYLKLDSLAVYDHALPGAWARNILIASGLMNYEEPVFIGSVLKSSRKGRYHWTRSQAINSDFRVFPNPAKDYIIAEYKMDENELSGVIKILDLHGRMLKSEPLKKKQNQQLIQVADLVPGTYLIQILIDGVVRESLKEVIYR